MTAPELCRTSTGVSNKTVRIEARATKAEVRIIRAAADAERVSMSTYVIKAALEKAAQSAAA